MSIRIVLADDQPLVRAGFCVLLDAEPEFEIVGVAEDGLQAVDLVRRTGPDVAVLDVTLPGMSGFELLPALREREGLGELPAVFLSARVQDHDIAEGRALGATYLTKPFVGKALDAAIARAVADADGW